MADAESKDGEKKSSKKLFLIIGIIVLLLGGGAGGYFFFMNKPADTETAEKSAETKPEEKKDEPEDATQADLYYELLNPLLVNFPPGSSAKIIKVSVTILAKGETSIEALKKHEPMIRNNLLMAISSMGADKVKTLEGKQELQAIMLSEVGKVMERMTKKNPVKAVYFTEFVTQ